MIDDLLPVPLSQSLSLREYMYMFVKKNAVFFIKVKEIW